MLTVHRTQSFLFILRLTAHWTQSFQFCLSFSCTSDSPFLCLYNSTNFLLFQYAILYKLQHKHLCKTEIYIKYYQKSLTFLHIFNKIKMLVQHKCTNIFAFLWELDCFESFFVFVNTFVFDIIFENI